MTVSPTSGPGSNTPTASRSSTGGADDLGQDAFLKLLVAQLRHQDPMSPMKDNDFIGQMAQFQMLEQLQRLNEIVAYQAGVDGLMQASGLLGKEVTTLSKGDSEPVSGTVSRVSIRDGEVVLAVDGREAYLSDVIQVGS